MKVLHAKSPLFKQLIKTFDLDIRSAALEPLTSETDNLTAVLKSKETIKTIEKMAKSKFTTEVEESAMEKFVKFETKDDKVEGFITGERKMVKESECFVIEVDGERMLLPSNVKLNRKLENLCKINEEKLSKGEGVETQITFLGKSKVEGVANPMSDFKVLTA